MSIFDRFKKAATVEQKVEIQDTKLLQAILVELRIANELHVFKLNPDDAQRKFIAREREKADE